MEKTYEITQKQIKEEVDLNTRHKIFDLTLDQFGPYKVQFDRPGRHVLLSGEKGHIAMVFFTALCNVSRLAGRPDPKPRLRIPHRGAHLRDDLPA